MITPRPYISYSQLYLVEKNPEEYVKQYLYGKRNRESINIKFGAKMADSLEKDEATDDTILDFVTSQLPKFEKMDIPFEVELMEGKEKIIVLAKPDSWSTICPKCNRNAINYEPQQTIQKRADSLEQGDEGSDGSLEQRQEVFGGNPKKNEPIKNGNQATSLYSGAQDENQQSFEQGKNKGKSKDKKQNGLSELENGGNEKGQMEVRVMRKGGRPASRPHQTVRTLSGTKIGDEQRKNSLSGLPQKNTNISERNEHCKVCNEEPYPRFYEYKTSVNYWTQKMADESDQITFYATAFYLRFKKVPKDIELVQVKTRYGGDKGGIEATGEIVRFKTKRTTLQALKMQIRIKKGWKKIKELCEREML